VTENDVRAAIRKSVAQFDADALPVDKNFFAAGLDSLDYATLLMELLERHGLGVSDAVVQQCSSICGILEYAKQVAAAQDPAPARP
jgi:acyl carrier protein